MKRLVFAALMTCAGQVSAQERMEITTCQAGWDAGISIILPDLQAPQMSVASAANVSY